MSLDIRFTDDFSPQVAAKAASFLMQPRLYIDTAADYGNQRHSEWVERTEADLVTGRKFGVAAVDAGRVAGVVIAKHADAHTIDIRNISIAPESRQRDYGRFAVRQLLYIAQADLPGIRAVTVDTKANNAQMIAFLEKLGFSPFGEDDLYGSGNPDLLLRYNMTSAK